MKGRSQILFELQIDDHSFTEWVRKYSLFGRDGLIPSSRNKHYPETLKLHAVKDYLSGLGSQGEICSKYEISHFSILQQWIKRYDSHEKFKSHNTKGDRIMTNGRKTTYEERIEIVAFCVANNDIYQLTADKYQVSYQQVYTWTQKYKEQGYEALLDRRGKHKKPEELSESEKHAAQLKLLEAENRRLKMENDFLKKVGRGGKEATNSRTRQEGRYIAIKELHEEERYPITELCNFADIARSSYYKWINRPESESDKKNAIILEKMILLYTEVQGIYGYRRMTMNINRILRKQYNY